MWYDSILNKIWPEREVEPEASTPQPRIVEAVGSVVRTNRDKTLAKKLETAMSDAILEAIKQGIPLHDRDRIRALQLKARQGVLAGN